LALSNKKINSAYWSQFFLLNLIEYFHKFESISKTVSAHVSGGPGVQFNEKTDGQKTRETVPLNKKKPEAKKSLRTFYEAF
jgi:hypothetical protein